MTALHFLMLINGLDKTRLSFSMVLDGISQEQAQQYRDGPEGWNIIEIMCHILDYQDVYLERIDSMLHEDQPIFKSYDRFELVEQHDYAGQNLQAVLESYSETRDFAIALLKSLTDEQWQRRGFYPDGGAESAVSSIAVQLLAHDNDHLEQIMRILQAAK